MNALRVPIVSSWNSTHERLDDLEKRIDKLYRLFFNQRDSASKLVFLNSANEVISMFTLNNVQQTTIHIAGVDAAGAVGLLNPTAPIVITTDVTGVVSIVQSADGLSAIVTGLKVGTVNLTATGTSSLGVAITSSPFAITVTDSGALDATSLVITADAPIAQPVVATAATGKAVTK